MKNNQYPRLCGGTLFVLLRQALKQRVNARAHYAGDSDGLSAPNMLSELIRVAQPHYTKPATSTFNHNTSEYKACSISSGTYLPFDDASFSSSFDKQVRSSYQDALAAMSVFAESYIDIGNADKCEWLIKALCELIEEDDSISENDTFYICADGQALPKSDIRALTSICFQSFLLGVWHFIVMNRQDNSVGRNTFEQWHEKPETKGKSWKFVSQIGSNYSRTITVTICELNLDNEPEVVTVLENEPFTKDAEPLIGNTSANTTNQTVNTPAIFINHGTDCIQINNTGTLNIDRKRG